LKRRQKLRLILTFLLLGFFFIQPSFADETTIVLDQQTAYVDVPVEATAPAQITIQTTTGTPQTNSGFIDSWVELWQGVIKLGANDDGAHSATNVLASYLSLPIEVGTYFIRATSFAYMCCNQLPTGSYLLTWDGVVTVPTPTPTPLETIQPTIEPTPDLTPTPTPTIEPTPTEEPTPTQEPVAPNEPIEVVETQTATPEPTIEEEVTLEPEPVEQIVEEETIETPVIEPELSVEELQEQIDAEYIEENTIQLEVPTALENIPGAEQIFAATEAILNVGSDMTETQREESQSVVVGAIVVTQVAQMASVTSSRRRLK
jgi:hypothetical protein